MAFSHADLGCCADPPERASAREDYVFPNVILT
jgi:hypothetical protein